MCSESYVNWTINTLLFWLMGEEEQSCFKTHFGREAVSTRVLPQKPVLLLIHSTFTSMLWKSKGGQMLQRKLDDSDTHSKKKKNPQMTMETAHTHGAHMHLSCIPWVQTFKERETTHPRAANWAVNSCSIHRTSMENWEKGKVLKRE